jgi:hypothetical protein
MSVVFIRQLLNVLVEVRAERLYISAFFLYLTIVQKSHDLASDRIIETIYFIAKADTVRYLYKYSCYIMSNGVN